jgi:hypothetical protein
MRPCAGHVVRFVVESEPSLHQVVGFGDQCHAYHPTRHPEKLNCSAKVLARRSASVKCELPPSVIRATRARSGSRSRATASADGSAGMRSITGRGTRRRPTNFSQGCCAADVAAGGFYALCTTRLCCTASLSYLTHRMTMLGHVLYKVTAHDAQADHANFIASRFHDMLHVQSRIPGRSSKYSRV